MADAESNPNHLIACLEEQCYISSPQKEILHHSPFVGETVNLPHHESSPSSSVPVASIGIVITSLTAETTQDAGKDSGPQDVFHTPPEQSSLPTSQQSEYAEALELVNLSDDSELGLGQVKIKQRIEPESKDGLDESPHEENEVAETSEKRPELPVLPSSIREGIEKKARDKKEERKGNNNSEGDSGDDGVSWLELAKAREKNKRQKRIESESKEGLDESPHEENEVAKTSEKRPELRVLPSSIREGFEKKARDKKEERKGNSGFDFTVMKALIQNNSEGDSDDDGVSWLELAKARGIDFPRPRWKKEKDDEKN